jgi:hypothetical protein
MKTIFRAALFLSVSVFALMAFGLPEDQRREFISETMNADVRQLLENSDKNMIGQEPFSSNDTDIIDHMISFYDTDHGLLVTLQALNQRLNEDGHAIPDVYSSELVAIVFVDESLLWYQSESAKSTLKAEMARLLEKKSI